MLRACSNCRKLLASNASVCPDDGSAGLPLELGELRQKRIGGPVEGEPRVVQLVPSEPAAQDGPDSEPPRPPSGPRPALKRVK